MPTYWQISHSSVMLLRNTNFIYMAKNKLLIVDANTALTTAIVDQLKKNGQEAFVLTSPDEIFSWFNRNLCRAVILNVSFAHTKLIRDIHVVYPMLPIILWGDSNHKQNSQVAISVGADAYISKQASPQILIKDIERTLSVESTPA